MAIFGSSGGQDSGRRHSRHPEDAVASANRRDGRPVAASRPRGEHSNADDGERKRYSAPPLKQKRESGIRGMVASTPNIGKSREQERRRREERERRGSRGHDERPRASRRSGDRGDRIEEEKEERRSHDRDHASRKTEKPKPTRDGSYVRRARMAPEDADDYTTSEEEEESDDNDDLNTAEEGSEARDAEEEESEEEEEEEERPKSKPRRKSTDEGETTAAEHSPHEEKDKKLEGAGAAAAAASVPMHKTKSNNRARFAEDDEKKHGDHGKKGGAGGGGSTGDKTKHKPRKYKMSGVSNMLLLMEDKSYHPSCFSVYSFPESLPHKTVREFFEALATSYPKYLYRITGRGKKFGPAKWEYCPDFKVEENIEEVTMNDGANGDKQFFDLMGKFVARVYDYSKPPWEALLVQNFDGRDGSKSALAIKIHHAFSDGQGMIMSYHTTLQAMASKQDVAAIQRSFDAKQKKSEGLGFLRKLYPGTMIHSWHDGLTLAFTPRRKEFTYADKKRKRVKGRLYCHSKGMKLSDIKMIKDAIKGVKGGNNITVNDVATALLTRAARRCADKLAEPEKRRIKDKKFCLLIPISVRPKGNWELENYSTGSLAWFDFRSDKECGFEQALLQAHKEMKIIKESRLSQLTLFWFNVFYKYPWTFAPNWPVAKGVYCKIFEQYSVASNVPGPPKKISFGGIEATSYQVLPPASAGKGTMAIGMISYADEFKIAMSCDDEQGLKDLPRKLCEAFEEVAEEWIAEAQKRLGKKGEGEKEKEK